MINLGYWAKLIRLAGYICCHTRCGYRAQFASLTEGPFTALFSNFHTLFFYYNYRGHLCNVMLWVTF